MSAKNIPRIENGVVVGTTSDKYISGNPVVRWMVQGFDAAVASLAAAADPARILEIGCGEGHVTRLLLEHTRASIHATELSEKVLGEAIRAIDSPRVKFDTANIYQLPASIQPADLVVCCEVLEHLPDPAAGLRQLAAMAPMALLSVPREPLWRTLNLIRGAYWKELGNTPGHIQHWSQRSFLKFVQQELDVLQVRSPLPWVFVLARSRASRT